MAHEAAYDVRLRVLSSSIPPLASASPAIHSVDRAIEQGSLDAVIEAENLRPAIVDALSKSLKKHHRHAAHKASFQRIPALMSSTYYSLTLEER